MSNYEELLDTLLNSTDEDEKFKTYLKLKEIFTRYYRENYGLKTKVNNLSKKIQIWKDSV